MNPTTDRLRALPLAATLACALTLLGCSEDDVTGAADAAVDAADPNDPGADGGSGHHGFGPPPCDDPVGPEVCDGRDNDCDGQVDEGYHLSCAPCAGGAPCIEATIIGRAWERGVKRNLRDGNDLGIGLPPLPKRNDFIYIANSADDTVSKLRTADGVEVGRFRVGDNPSRTAVDGNGDAWVAMRGHINESGGGPLENVIKIDGDCVPEVSPPAATRECILLDVPDVGQLLRGVAIDARGDAWIGSHYDMEVIKLHRHTGEVLARVDVSDPISNPYGLAIDEDGYIWVASLAGTAHVSRIDPVTEERDVAFTYEELGRNAAYGIAADGRGSVWFGTNTRRIVQVDVATQTFVRFIDVPGAGATRGVAVDDEGFVWAADSGVDALHRIDPNDPDNAVSIMVGTHPVGVAIDHDGFVWSVNLFSEDAYKMDKDGLHLLTLPVGRVPYTYSDMVGSAFRVFRTLRGRYVATFTSGVGGAVWSALRVRGNLPASATTTVRVRASDVSPVTGPWEEVALAGLDGTFAPVVGQHIEVEAVFITEDRGDVPNIESITFTFTSP